MEDYNVKEANEKIKALNDEKVRVCLDRITEILKEMNCRIYTATAVQDGKLLQCGWGVAAN